METNKAYFAKPGQQTQRASIFESWGGNLKVATNIAVNDELPAENVLVSVRSSSVNPIDWKIRRGDMKAVVSGHFPQIPGRDVSGKIVKVGSEASSRFAVGDEVYGLAENLTGTSCEFVNVSWRSLAKKPSNISWNEAAAFPLVLLTAHQGIIQIGQLTSGQNLLVLGGSSAVGSMAIQLAKLTGARVYTTCGTSSVDYVKEIGADVVIDYKKEDFIKVLGDAKMDLVFDAVGKKSDRDSSFDVVKSKGMVVTTTPNDDDHHMNVTEAAKTVADVIWKKVSNYISNGVSYKPFLCSDKQGHVLEELKQSIVDGKIKVKLDSVVSLEELQAAHDKSESGKVSGKIAVQVTTD